MWSLRDCSTDTCVLASDGGNPWVVMRADSWFEAKEPPYTDSYWMIGVTETGQGILNRVTVCLRHLVELFPRDPVLGWHLLVEGET